MPTGATLSSDVYISIKQNWDGPLEWYHMVVGQNLVTLVDP